MAALLKCTQGFPALSSGEWQRLKGPLERLSSWKAPHWTASSESAEERYQHSLRKWMATPSSEALSTSGYPESAIDRRPYFQIYYNDVYEVKLPPNHRFPMEKYRKVRQLVQQWVSDLPIQEQGLVHCNFNISPLSTVEELTTTHSPEYVRRFLDGEQTKKEQRNVGFPWSDEGVKRSLSSVGGTVAAACDVCRKWKKNSSNIAPWGAHVAGGTHHAFYDYGEGFSVFSDIAVAANVVLDRFPDLVKRILIVDLDTHQGNGNAVLFQGRPEVFTFSIHCQANYFSDKQDSDLDIELPPDCTDSTYLMTLKHWLKRLKEETGPFDLIFFQAGVDILEHDRLGRMSVSPVGVQRRNQLVYEFARDMNVPLVICMGGGYPKTNDWTPILVAHASVYFQAHQFLLQQYKSLGEEQS